METDAPVAETTRPDYFDRFETLAFDRDASGVLVVRFHTNDQECIFSSKCHAEWAPAFEEIAGDRENRVVVLTGTGKDFLADWDAANLGDITRPPVWDELYAEGRRALRNLLDIDVPVIGAVNGPAHIHAELLVLSDIVLAADAATFQDLPHLDAGVVPGDGVQVVWPEVLGINRGRYFLLTQQVLSAKEALDLGVVSEVLPQSELMPRALELAGELAQFPTLTLRYTRLAVTQRYKRLIAEGATLGLALEGLSAAALRPS